MATMMIKDTKQSLIALVKALTMYHTKLTRKSLADNESPKNYSVLISTR